MGGRNGPKDFLDTRPVSHAVPIRAMSGDGWKGGMAFLRGSDWRKLLASGIPLPPLSQATGKELLSSLGRKFPKNTGYCCYSKYYSLQPMNYTVVNTNGSYYSLLVSSSTADIV